MNRKIVSLFCAACLMAAAAPAWGQTSSENKVSGPAQVDPKKSTGKSYKKGTKQPSTKEANPSTGQTKRLGNTGNLTKNGDDVNGKRAEKPGSKKGGAASSPPQ